MAKEIAKETDLAGAAEEDTPKLKKKAQTKAEQLEKKKQLHKDQLEKKRRQNTKKRVQDQLDKKAKIKSNDFVSTPTNITFADYLPDVRYVVKIDLTNVSHQISSIRYHSLRLVIYSVPSFLSTFRR